MCIEGRGKGDWGIGMEEPLVEESESLGISLLILIESIKI